MRIISRKTLINFWEQPEYRDAEQPLKAWFAEAKHADWKTSSDIKEKYRNASFLGNNHVVFNIAGNKYRLVVKLQYNTCTVYIRFIGTHAQYNKIDAENI
jgi:mRNA interferase HigB